MISSLLSLFITSNLQPDISTDIITLSSTKPAFVKEADLEISNFTNSNPIPVKKLEFISPIIHAESAIAIDLNTNTILFEQNAHEKRSIASITKLMTILIILEENSLDEIVTVSNNSALVEGSTMYLRNGETISVKNLLYGTIIQSANDAAIALAEHNAGSVTEFINKMNNKALELGLVNTHFQNPTGLDHPNNYSSAYDVVKLAKQVYEHPFIQEAAKLKNFSVSSEQGNYIHKLNSTNELLDSYLNIKGLKTGRTLSAGLCFVAIAENNTNNSIITVVLKSPDRFKETKILIDWIFRAYNW